MDPERRAALNARRASVQFRARLHERRRYLNGLDEQLEATGTPFRLWYGHEDDYHPWHGDLVTHRWNSLGWLGVHLSIDTYVRLDERAAFACTAIAERIAPEDTLRVVFDDGRSPQIELSRVSFERHAELIMEKRNLWLSGVPRWLVEFYGERVQGVG